MKIKELKIKNLRKISDATLEFNKPLICLYGEVEQGKTTFLDAIKILFSSGFPNDLIQHGKKDAEIILTLENGVISRSFYIDKNGETKGRALNAIVENKKLKASDLKKMFNPFQLNQDFLKEMTNLERKKFFIDLFNVDTSDIDVNILQKEQEAKNLRIEIRSFGEIDLTEIEKPNLQELQEKEQSEKERLNKIVISNHAKNAKLKANWQIENDNHLKEIQIFNKKQSEILRKRKDTTTLALKITDAIFDFNKFTGTNLFENSEIALDEFIDNMDLPEEQKKLTQLPEPEYIDEKQGCDTSMLEKIQTQISDAKVNELKYNNYLQNVEKQKQKEQKQKELSSTENDIRELRKQKISKLSKYGKEIKGLSFNQNGDLTFENTINDNLSTSQIVRLGSLLSKLYPNSLLDLELIDRGESLGKKIWEFIDKAEKEQKTILASIVGEKPAETPEKVGVFIVENGNLKIK